MKIKAQDLSLEEKFRLLCAEDIWQTNSLGGKLRSVRVSDGPHGLRKTNGWYDNPVNGTAMPNLSLIACSWDRSAAKLDGATIADDCIENGVDILLAPGVNIKRTPLCGRNFEYFSEDPYLAGELGKAFIEGVQEKGVGTSLKHFACNNREYNRLYQSSEVDERTLQEIYFPAFRKSLEAKPWTVMCSFNPVNGVLSFENEKLLKKTLRKQFGFEGTILSDWDNVRNSYKSLKAGLDVRFPYCETAFSELKNAYEKGLITDEEIDFSVNKVLELITKAETAVKKTTTDKKQRHRIAADLAKECMVLLKNEGDVLPLKGGSVCVLGNFAANPTVGGGGSAYAVPSYQQENLAALLNKKNSGIKAKYIGEFVADPCFYRCVNVRAALSAAYKADVAVVCAGNTEVQETEDFDRPSMRLNAVQEDLILKVAEVNPETVVLLYTGSAVDMSPWIDKVKAVLWVGFAGEGANEAAAEILCGNCSPCGKLSETYPLSLEDTPDKGFAGTGLYNVYAEGIFVGYRHYDKAKKEVLFPFGHGLSYAFFEYSDLKIEKRGETDYIVRYKITNLSDTDAKEISQVYVKDVFSSLSRPEKELKGFEKTLIKAHDSAEIAVSLDFSSFAYYSPALERFYVENGDFEILVGASSRDIRLSYRIEISLPDETQVSI